MSAAPTDEGKPLPTGAIGADDARYDLTLFVSGASQLSLRAISDARQLCETSLGGRYRLTVVDVHDRTAAVHNSRVLATPTLVKNHPLPVRKLVGDLSRPERVLRALDIPMYELRGASG